MDNSNNSGDGQALPSAKRRRLELTVSQKQEIIKYYLEKKKIKQTELILHFNQVFNCEIKKQTMSDLLRNKDKILSLSACESEFNKRIRLAKYPELEEKLYDWSKEMMAQNVHLKAENYLDKAKEIGKSLNIPENFGYSAGWLKKFKNRYNISIEDSLCNETSLANEEYDSKNDLIDEDKTIENYEDIFGDCDETVEKRKITSKEAFDAFNLIYSYFEQKASSSYKSLDLLKSLKNELEFLDDDEEM